MAQTHQIAAKIDVTEAKELASQAYGNSNDYVSYLFETPVMEQHSSFYVFQGMGKTSGSFGFFSVNPWTGDVWELWNCRKFVTPASQKTQEEIKKRFSSKEIQQYARLRSRKPECLN
jgi:hypothetical protein